MRLYRSSGLLSYSIVDPANYYKLSATADPQIASYYRSLIPKWFKCNGTRYAPHITIVRKEKPLKLESWGKYEGKVIEFEYEPTIYFDETYYWLNCYSKELETIREELGLPIWAKYNCPPDLKHCFHMTIGNRKNI